MKLHLGINLIYATKRWPEPDEWGRQVTQRWGLKYVQFCFDLLDPRSSPEARKAMAAKVREASAKYGFEVQSAFIGLGAYTYNLLLHPFPEFRKDALEWCRLAAITAAELGSARGGGTHRCSQHERLSRSRQTEIPDGHIGGGDACIWRLCGRSRPEVCLLGTYASRPRDADPPR